MAQVASRSIGPLIDDDLAYLAEEWTSIPGVVAEWDDWEEHDRLDFVIEWPIREDSLRHLRQWADQELLTSEQHAKLRELEDLVERYRPDLERLLAD